MHMGTLTWLFAPPKFCDASCMSKASMTSRGSALSMRANAHSTLHAAASSNLRKFFAMKSVDAFKNAASGT